MQTKSRAAALLEQAGVIAERSYPIMRTDGGEQAFWPDNIRDFEIIGTEGGDRYGTPIVEYQHADTGIIVTFNNGGDEKPADADTSGRFSYKLGDQEEVGTFDDLDDIPKILRKVPAQIKKMDQVLADRLPNPEGWERDGKVSEGTVEYTLKVDRENVLTLTIMEPEDLFLSSAVEYVIEVRNDGGYTVWPTDRQEGLLDNIDDLARLLGDLTPERADESLNERGNPVKGNTSEFWPDNIRGFEQSYVGDGSYRDGYGTAHYQDEESGVVIVLKANQEGEDGTFEYAVGDRIEKGTFQSVGDIPDVLKTVPRNIERLIRDLYKRLPKVDGWELYDNGSYDLFNELYYTYTVNPDIRAEIVVHRIGDLFSGDPIDYSAEVRDSGSYEVIDSSERRGKLKGVRDLEKLMKTMADAAEKAASE